MCTPFIRQRYIYNVDTWGCAFRFRICRNKECFASGAFALRGGSSRNGSRKKKYQMEKGKMCMALRVQEGIWQYTVKPFYFGCMCCQYPTESFKRCTVPFEIIENCRVNHNTQTSIASIISCFNPSPANRFDCYMHNIRNDDEYVACVVRNVGIWIGHKIGQRPEGTNIGMWCICVLCVCVLCVYIWLACVGGIQSSTMTKSVCRVAQNWYTWVYLFVYVCCYTDSS